MDGPGDGIGIETDGIHCTRCSLYYPSTQSSCHHCKDLTAIEAKSYGDEFRQRSSAQNMPLAKTFIFVAIILIIVVIVSYFFL